ncbi:MAG: galactokinase [Bacteroidota bacterium]
MKNKILEHFQTRFDSPKFLVKAPGRANIIGEHTDYNHGLALPFAIDQHIVMVFGENSLGRLRIFAADIDAYEEIEITNLAYQSEGWTRYFINSLLAAELNDCNGMDIVFGGNLPQGAGISSSSAIACGFLTGINAFYNLDHNSDKVIDLASQAENGIGLNGGIMDQTCIVKGRKDKALRIDFRDTSVKHFEMPDNRFSFYLFNSGQKHDLVETGYNQRRATCEQALKTIQSIRPRVKTLRDVTLEDINTILKDHVAQRRCLHVLEENLRVESTCQVLLKKDYHTLGAILLESHKSLSKLYEISTPEIDYLVERSQQIPAILGSRIMGGGFGGCTINFVKGELHPEELERLKQDYEEKCGFELQIHKVSAGDGVRVLEL